jgi:hypothetical protein
VRFLNSIGIILNPLLGVLVLAPIAALLLRFRRSTGEERQQIKWVIYAVAVLTVAITVVSIWPALDGTPHRTVLFLAGFLAIPIAVGIAILKHRLYDIDVLINRTLVYGSLTAVLALVYAGGVVLSQGVLRVLTGQGSTFAVVVSTLVIAALFNPLRLRIQTFIDRAFYRKEVRCEGDAGAFSASCATRPTWTAGRRVDPGRARDVQPEHTSLWLRPATREARDRVE